MSSAALSSLPARFARRPLQGRSAGAYVALGVLLATACALLVAPLPAAERPAALRYYALFAAACIAVATPHILLPDELLGRLRLTNPSPPALLARSLRRLTPLTLLVLAPLPVLAFLAPGAFTESLGPKSFAGLTTLLAVAGAALYSFAVYVHIGPVSQAWQEGTRGHAWRWFAANTPAQPLGLPDGLIPALTATYRVFLVNAGCIVVSAWLGARVTPAAALVPGVLLLAWASFRCAHAAPHFDRVFYQTNTFYAEIYHQAGGVRASDRPPIPYEAVYWTPRRLRPHTWALLRQLDRRLPLGRVVFLGHLVLWIVAFRAPGAFDVAALLFMAAQVALTGLLTARRETSPFHLLQAAPRSWLLARFFAMLRWALPFALSLGGLAAVSDRVTLPGALGWTGAFALTALVVAGLVTQGAEASYRRRYA